MVRPRYETKADLTREDLAAAKFVRALKRETAFIKLPKGHRADFLVSRDKVTIGYLEVKTRTCKSTTYETYHVSKDKLTTLLQMAEREGVRAGLLVQWKDRLGFINVDRFLNNATFKTGGRWDRNDPYDVEEMAEIDINEFTFID